MVGLDFGLVSLLVNSKQAVYYLKELTDSRRGSL